MSDGESTPPARRPRPSYGLPGPTPAATGNGSAADPGQQGPFGAPAPGGSDPYAPQTGPLPPSGRHGPPERRRRGLLPLIIGLVLLIVVAPAAAIIGIVWSFSSLVGDAGSGPVALGGASSQIEMSANEMLILYIPAEDADAAECTATGTSAGHVSTVPSSGAVTFSDGSEYMQTLGVATLEDTTVSIECTGTDAPAYLGPYSLFGMAAPLLIGPFIGVIAGLIGLVLTVVGIVLLLRSRRS